MRHAIAFVPFVVGLVSAVAACRPASTPDSAAPPSDTASLESLRVSVLDARGEPTCTDVTQCRVIAFGAKPCGGPRSYLLWSTATIDSAILAAAVERFNARESELNREEGRMSDCEVVTAPRLVCESGRCAASRQ